MTVAAHPQEVTVDVSSVNPTPSPGPASSLHWHLMTATLGESVVHGPLSLLRWE